MAVGRFFVADAFPNPKGISKLKFEYHIGQNSVYYYTDRTESHDMHMNAKKRKEKGSRISKCADI